MRRRTRDATLIDLFLIVCLVTIVLFIGTRDISVGSDTGNYVRNYYRVQECACLDGNFERGFQILTLLVAVTGASSTAYLSVLAGVLVALVWLLIKNFDRLVGEQGFGGLKLRLALLGVVLLSPFFFNASVNVLRHGLSAFMLLNTGIFVLRKRWFSATVFGLLAVSFHKTALLYLPLLPCVFLINSPQRRMRFVIALMMLATAYAVGLTEEIVRVASSLVGIDVHALFAEYGASATHYRGGVRRDFLVFSIGWYLLGIVANGYFIRSTHRSIYRTIIDLYGLLLVPFLLFGWGNFSDRLLFVPWQMIPVIVAAAVVFGRVRARSGGAIYLLGLLGSTLGLLLSVHQNQTWISTVIRGLLD